jgi:uncharacterized RDD family membrane protein YckC
MDIKNAIDKFVKSLGGLGKVSAATLAVDLPSQDGVRYGGFNKRVYAFGLDSIFALIVFLPLLMLFPSYQAPSELTDILQAYKAGQITQEQYITGIAPYTTEFLSSLFKSFTRDSIIMGVIMMAFWIYKSATPGKMIFGMEIVDAKTLGKPTKMQLFLRYIGYFVCTFTLGLGFLWIIFDSKKRGLHDYMAGTVVIYPKPLDADWQKQLFKRNGYVVIAFLIIAAIWFYFFNK